jgi:hypothetical protein
MYESIGLRREETFLFQWNFLICFRWSACMAKVAVLLDFSRQFRLSS